MEDSKKKNFRFFIIVLVLILIILFILLFTRFGFIDNTGYLIPTGNIDVFDIDIDCNCSNRGIDIDGDGKEDEECISQDDNGKKRDIPYYNPGTDKYVVGQVFVDDKQGNYIYQQNLKIFVNPAFEMTNKVAPGSQNIYNFVVHNSTNSRLKYYVEMYNETEYEVNMKYRLRKNNQFVVGNETEWVTPDKLVTELDNINSGASDSYSLDWQWFYNDGKDTEDTIAGENMTNKYKLNIRVHFEQA